MKKVYFTIMIALLLGFSSCENAEWEFSDYEFAGVYFPYQYPVRTLILGDYYFDNENDKNLKFEISIRVGGMYENHSDWTVDYQIDASLVDGLFTDAGDTIKALPSEYYTLNPSNSIVIPKGEFYNSIEVQLTESFLEDSASSKVHYVIPLELTSTSADSILVGEPAIADPDPRIAGDWILAPKNFTLFGIKYINPYHGQYFYRGQSVVRDIDGDIIETIEYRARYIENNEIIALNTTGIDEVEFPTRLKTEGGSNFTVNLTFDDNNNCDITESEDSPFPVTGSGKFVEDADEWGGKTRDAIHLTYQVTEGDLTHSMTDTLVIRDRGVAFEEFVPVVNNID